MCPACATTVVSIRGWRDLNGGLASLGRREKENNDPEISDSGRRRVACTRYS
jgi:hypothetical protein